MPWIAIVIILGLGLCLATVALSWLLKPDALADEYEAQTQMLKAHVRRR